VQYPKRPQRGGGGGRNGQSQGDNRHRTHAPRSDAPRSHTQGGDHRRGDAPRAAEGRHKPNDPRSGTWSNHPGPSRGRPRRAGA
jgi:hypothetical protein